MSEESDPLLAWGKRVSTNALDDLRTLTVEELSQATGIQAWRIYEMLKQEGKAPPHFRIGSTYRFPVSGVRRWMEELAALEQQRAKRLRPPSTEEG